MLVVGEAEAELLLVAAACETTNVTPSAAATT